MKIDIARLRADIHDTVAKIRETKAPLRRTWRAPMHDLQARLRSLKAKATDLCILRAYARGRIHLPQDPETCSKIAQRMSLHYAKEGAAA